MTDSMPASAPDTHDEESLDSDWYKYPPDAPSESTEGGSAALEEEAERLLAEMQPLGALAARAVLEAAARYAPHLPTTVGASGDGGIVVVTENEALSRELTFAVPDDGARQLFAATDAAGDVLLLAGSVRLPVAFESLFRWVRGFGGEPSKHGLRLPKGS